MEYVDVLIVGAGISGIGAAVHLQERCPGKRFAIIERRADVGGTWDLFRYPGVRSDSDMHTLGFRFKPWTQAKAIADGPSILSYLNETVDEHDLMSKIRFHQQVKRASWSSANSRWTVEVIDGSTRAATTLSCSFLFMCGGYYNYDHGYLPDFPDHDTFTGRIVHPQHWPTDLNYKGKNVVVIGSGATAVTLVPALVADGAAKVTMLQRSPTYMAAGPSEDRIANALRKMLPAKAAYAVVRWKNILLGSFIFNLARQKPDRLKSRLLEGVRKELGPDYDIATNFTPSYKPWEQRLCLVPDSDMFAAIRAGRAVVTTGQIERFTPTGIVLKSGEELLADLIVTATGLNLQMLAGVEVTVDGKGIDVAQTVLHKGVMLSGMPNLAMWFGYTNASWTLKADLTSEYMCRMLNYMDTHHVAMVMPTYNGSLTDTEEFVDFSSGYFQRAKHLLPKQGHGLPWKLDQNYFRDARLLRRGRVDDEGLVFSGPRAPGSVEAVREHEEVANVSS